MKTVKFCEVIFYKNLIEFQEKKPSFYLITCPISVYDWRLFHHTDVPAWVNILCYISAYIGLLIFLTMSSYLLKLIFHDLTGVKKQCDEFTERYDICEDSE